MRSTVINNLNQTKLLRTIREKRLKGLQFKIITVRLLVPSSHRSKAKVKLYSFSKRFRLS